MIAWAWAGRYLIAMMLAWVLGALLGSIPLFREAGIGSTGLTASSLVRFLGYGSAVLLLWLLGRTAATQIPEERRELSFIRHVIEPLITLIAVIFGHKVLLLLEAEKAELRHVREHPMPGWRCSGCGEANPGHFDLCWNCERVRTGEEPADTAEPEAEAE